jgi:hypothetical protein
MMQMEAVLENGKLKKLIWVLYSNVFPVGFHHKLTVVMGPPEYIGVMPIRTDIGVVT